MYAILLTDHNGSDWPSLIEITDATLRSAVKELQAEGIEVLAEITPETNRYIDEQSIVLTEAALTLFDLPKRPAAIARVFGVELRDGVVPGVHKCELTAWAVERDYKIYINTCRSTTLELMATDLGL